jgi:hypothetical protein
MMNARIEASVLCGALLLLPVAAQADSDPSTGLPLHPGITLQQKLDSFVCGKPSKLTIYDTPMPPMAEYLAWSKNQLPGFLHVHQVWANRAQELFYSSDGTKGISITGTPQGGLVFAITYIKISGSLTTHQQQAFSPSNASCK